MSRWRVGVGLLLVAGFGVPLLLPLLDLLLRPAAWAAWNEGPPLLGLARNSLALTAGTLLLALPAGVLLAILLFRTDLPAQRLLRALLLLSVFLPLPVFVA